MPNESVGTSHDSELESSLVLCFRLTSKFETTNLCFPLTVSLKVKIDLGEKMPRPPFPDDVDDDDAEMSSPPPEGIPALEAEVASAAKRMRAATVSEGSVARWQNLIPSFKFCSVA